MHPPAKLFPVLGETFEIVVVQSGQVVHQHPAATVFDGGIAAQRLKSFIERIERLEEEKAALGADVREVYSEAKGEGFDVKIMRQVIRLRKMEADDRQEQEHLRCP